MKTRIFEVKFDLVVKDSEYDYNSDWVLESVMQELEDNESIEDFTIVEVFED